MAKIYTKTGDAGTTGLFGGSRVEKDDLRVQCYGTIDESSAMMGLAYSLSEDAQARERLNTIQKRLLAMGAELASDDKGRSMLKDRISGQDIAYLEAVIDECMEFAGSMHGFVVPGANSFSAALHSARTIVRRGERCMVALFHAGGEIREELCKYVNRLSDCLFAMARREEMLCTVREIKDKVVQQLNANGGGGMPPLTLDTARQMALYAEEKGNSMGLPIVFAVVDKGGNLMLLNRMENALLVSIDVAIKKAFTASAMKLPTDVVGELSKPGAALYSLDKTNDGKLILFGGGYPYESGGEVVGGIGVSGGSAEQDMEIATYVLSRIQGRKE
jgi:ATP:cob(I)alamin adenosyltransferase